MEKLSELMQRTDWLNRNGNHYTSHRVANRLGWEDRLTQGAAYSTYLLPAARNIEPGLQLLYARSFCSMVLRNLIPHRFVQLILGKDNVTDAKKFVSVSVQPLDDHFPLASFQHRLDVMLGATVHETAHVLYTDGAPLLEVFKTLPKKAHTLLKQIENVVEDERIEMNIGQYYPGYANYLAQVKHFVFEYMLQHPLADEQQQVDERYRAVSELFMSFLYLVRYPKSADPALVDQYEPQLLEIKDILTPYPRTTEAVVGASVRILEIFTRLQNEEDAKNGHSGEEDENEEGEGEGGDSGGKRIRIRVKGLPGGSGASGQGTDSVGDDEEGEDFEEIEIDVSSVEGLAEALEGMMKAVADSDITENTAGEATVLGEDVSADGQVQTINKLEQRELGTYNDMAGEWLKLNPDTASGELATKFHDFSQLPKPAEYQDSLARVAPHTASLRAKLRMFNRNRVDTYRGLHEGMFDEDMLIDAKIGAKAVYCQNARIFNNGATIALLVDESGSMHSFNRYLRARDVAVLMHTALQGVNEIDFYCYGHTTEHSGIPGAQESTSLMAYYEGHRRGVKEALGNITHHNMNRDGHALLECAGRVRQFTKKPVVLFMVSDGMPSGSVPSKYRGGEEYVRKAVSELKKNDVHVIHIAIDESVKSETMFTDFVKFTNLSSLVADMTTLLGKVITKIQSPEIEFE